MPGPDEDIAGMTDRELAEQTLVELRALRENQERFRDAVMEAIDDDNRAVMRHRPQRRA